MIVRDEETTLPRCLKSVQDVADEVIVVDTGSQDNTVSIARDFGAKVYYFAWRDDFAAARNESLKYASGDWILQIDADEELLAGSTSLIRKAQQAEKDIKNELSPQAIGAEMQARIKQIYEG
jgi:glycosyltransferase involved in cell wall biosynthesis